MYVFIVSKSRKFSRITSFWSHLIRISLNTAGFWFIGFFSLSWGRQHYQWRTVNLTYPGHIDCHYLFKWRSTVEAASTDHAGYLTKLLCRIFQKIWFLYKHLQVLIHFLSIYVYFNGLHMKWITYLFIKIFENYKAYITKVSKFLIIILLRS